MNINEIELQLSNSHLTINLLLYRTVKEIIQAKISDKIILKLIEQTKLLIVSTEDFESKKDTLIKFTHTLSKSKNVQKNLSNLIENTIFEDIHFYVFKLGLNILRFKNYILEKSKLYSENFIANNDIHIMDFQYDQNMLNLPYSTRVSGALLIKVLFEDVNNSHKYKFYQSLINDINNIPRIDPETVLQIIFAESASQSIRSSSGSNYEDRFEKVLQTNGLSYEGQCFDNNLTAVEYDFKITLDNGNNIGVSAKRTLRERYKQNHENIDELEVNAMLLVTLGIDLNKAKVDHILAKPHHYIFVASDLYNQRDYFNKNEKVFPLNELNKDTLNSLF